MDGLLLLLLKRANKPLPSPLLDPLQPPVDLLQLVTEVGAHLRDKRGGDVLPVDGRKYLILPQYDTASGVGLHLGLQRSQPPPSLERVLVMLLVLGITG